ncbi:hypothetical protein MKW92_017286 [Papaver armeniacum]|nr:hypothetical protein MKW92_017286 [Papaver armeniacum]
MASSSSTLKPLPILPSSNSTLSSKSPKPSTIHFPSNISRLPSLKSKPSFKGFVAGGSEIHGTPKISIEDDCIDKVVPLSNCATAIDVQTMLLNSYLSLGRSYYVPLIEKSCKLIMDAARTSNTNTMCHQDARFHIEIRTHQRLINILYPTEKL